jgi:hypothetical protein
MSLRHYDRICDDLTDAVRRHLKRYPEDRDLLAYVEGVDLPDSGRISLHRSDLWKITSRLAAIELLVSHDLETIHRLEATTGPALVQALTRSPRARRPSPRRTRSGRSARKHR